jgi:hypothetical protein
VLELETCTPQFPIFILGCEAYDDNQRAMILDLISRTEQAIRTRSFAQVRMLLEAIWAQHDLSVLDCGVKDSYSQRVSSVVGRAGEGDAHVCLRYLSYLRYKWGFGHCFFGKV